LGPASPSQAGAWLPGGIAGRSSAAGVALKRGACRSVAGGVIDDLHRHGHGRSLRSSTMNTTVKPEPSKEGRELLESLRQSVTNALERKRRPGQYAVTWQDGKPLAKGDDAPLLNRLSGSRAS
jgi:hypothetical protein